MYIYSAADPGFFEEGKGERAKVQWSGAALGPQVGPQKLPMARQIYENELTNRLCSIIKREKLVYD